MATQNSANQKYANNADGFELAGGTTARKLTVSGGDVAIAGSGSAVITFPSATSTLATLAGSEALTNKSVNGVTLSTAQGTTNFLRGDGTYAAPASGLSWGATASGTSGTGVALTISNSASASTIGQSITIGNTQTNAATGMSIDMGTSSLANNGLLISCKNANTSVSALQIDFGTTCTGYGIYFPSRGGSGVKGIYWLNDINGSNSSTRTGVYQTAIAAGSNSTNIGYGIWQGTITQNGGSGYGIFQNIIGRDSGIGVGWYVEQLISTGHTGSPNAKYFSLNNNQSASLAARTTDCSDILHARTNTATTGTVADNFNLVYFKRTSVQNGTGGTFTSAGSVLSLENVATQTAGTLTDTVNVLKVTQSANSTGAAIYLSTAGTAKNALKLDTGFTTSTAPTGASTYILVDIGGTVYKLLAQAS